MLKVGLTGSIAVGKSYVCGIFRELGCHVLDADQTARDVVAPGTPGLRRIVEAFGAYVLNPDGSLDRKRLGSIVFSDPAKRQLLNSIVHPLVFEEQNRWLTDREAEDPEGIAIIDAALMIESGGYKRFDHLIVVWCRPDIQLRRLMSRDNLTEADAQQRIAAQMPQEEKKKYADFLIDTSERFADTRAQVLKVFETLRRLPPNSS
jgi:dephospho-CoA kinase